MKLDSKGLWMLMLVSVITNEIVMKDVHCDKPLPMISTPHFSHHSSVPEHVGEVSKHGVSSVWMLWECRWPVAAKSQSLWQCRPAIMTHVHAEALGTARGVRMSSQSIRFRANKLRTTAAISVSLCCDRRNLSTHSITCSGVLLCQCLPQHYSKWALLFLPFGQSCLSFLSHVQSCI